MNENKSFLGWLKYRWKMISVSDSRFFRFIWIVAIAVTFVTVIISAGVTAKANKAAAIEAEKQAKLEEEERTRQEEELLASYTDASATDASPTDATDWMLILVNNDNPLPDGYSVPEFTELRNEQKVDSRIYPDLQQMFDDARAAGHSPYITSSYRSKEDQQAQFDAKVNELLEQGKTQTQCEVEAAQLVAKPGYSEHETGLAIDVGSDAGEEAQNALWDWLAENSFKYGFIIRYPENKVTYTGISNEPWHLRYVGVDAAMEMKLNDQCLEEYLLFR
ncbi:MAG: M15 family metallopeptidase [Eubacterium sp.]|nr:M15 family metallopeptidase [Eubacterium sp.]